MFKKILVCLDGSEFAEQILPYAVEEAKRFDSQMVLLTVFNEPTLTSMALPGFPGVPVDTRAMELRAQQDQKDAVAYLKALAARLLSENSIKAECVTVMGVAGQAVVKYATENQVELIAIATHGRSGFGRAVIGSVADYVIRQSGIPILLVKPDKTKVK
jgi:nucleotide-binding universal stress UspA family protein